MRHNAGFTLIELLVVVAIIAIISTLAAPSIGQALANQQVKQATFELAQTLQTARSNAILYRRAIIVRSTYTTTAGRNWNGLTSGTPYQTSVPTAAQASLIGSSWYVLETGTNTALTTATDNRVTSTSRVNESVDVNNPNFIAIRFLPDSSVEIQATKDGLFTASTQTQTFSMCSNKTAARVPTGRQVIINRFGNVSVSEKSAGVCT
jgi:prepilin-type N-terminal cleavage/methylation domain-containing protein